MKFLALETDIGKIKKRFHCEGECEVMTIFYHGAAFFFVSLREFFYTILLFGIGVIAWIMQAPMEYIVIMLAATWFVFVFFTILRAFIDWWYDFIYVTTDRVVLVDQTTILRQRVMPIHHENIASVSSETQFWNIFPFGKVTIRLKEGEGEHITLRYIPDSANVAAEVSQVVTRYQRNVRQPSVQSAPDPVEAVATH
ncbi:MAG TPA: hypothetical protein VJB82_01870 [Candidatus Peribacterales bacterium]|nr:hypothetical protein [Candidatus Peribacterales bacterium]